MKRLAFFLIVCLLPTAARAQTFADLQFLQTADVKSWAPTSRITKIELLPDNMTIEHTRGDWPEITPPGWDGPIQFTVFAAINQGAWITAGGLEFWKGRTETGDPINHIMHDWYSFEPRLDTHQIRAGEQVCFFVAAGDLRLKTLVTVEERSDLACLVVPASLTGVFTFEGSTPPPPPPPVVIPPPAPPTDLTELTNRVMNLEQSVVELKQKADRLSLLYDTLNSAFNERMSIENALFSLLRDEVDQLKSRQVPAACQASIMLGVRVPISCKLTY